MTVGGIHDRERGLESNKRKTRAAAKSRLKTPRIGKSLMGTIRRRREIDNDTDSQESNSSNASLTPIKPSIDVMAYPDAEDEATVNAALVLLLEAISDLVPHSIAEWVSNHIHFSPTFGKASFNTYTDGALRSTKNQNVMSIIEVKRRTRSKDMDRILMQEEAEMVGWLLSGNSNLAVLNNQ
jgi:hypothetical protein